MVVVKVVLDNGKIFLDHVQGGMTNYMCLRTVQAGLETVIRQYQGIYTAGQ